MAYLCGTDPAATTRTWQFVMDDIVQDKKETALQDPAFKRIKDKLLVETQPADFLAVLRTGTVSTNIS